MNSLDPIPLARALIREPSMTPHAAGCFDLIESWLRPLGFTVWRQAFEGHGGPPAENFYARCGEAAPNLCFAGHVDVVPPGDPARWKTPPFEPEICDGMLYGRGAEDMKGAIAAMIAAVAAFLGGGAQTQGSISFLLTSDEEGSGANGTRPMLEWLAARGERIDACLVGEPTNPAEIGEEAKIGRRGSLLATLEVRGKQGHVAYPHLADNPVTRIVAMLHRLKTTPLDAGSAWFQPSNLEVTTIDVGNPAHNVIPEAARAEFNIRFSDAFTAATLQEWVHVQCAAVGGDYRLAMRTSGEAFLTEPGPLSEALAAAVRGVTGKTPKLTTSGGTSDARFIKDYSPVIEFGATHRTAHHVNECVRVQDINILRDVYLAFLRGYSNTHHF